MPTWRGNGLGASSGWNKSTWMNYWWMHAIHQKKWPLGQCCVNWWGTSIMVEIHPTIEINKRFPPSTPQYSPIDLCYTSEIYFLSTKFHPKLMFVIFVYWTTFIPWKFIQCGQIHTSKFISLGGWNPSIMIADWFYTIHSLTFIWQKCLSNNILWMEIFYKP